MEELLFKKLSEDATLPTRGSANAAGLDLYASEHMNLTVYRCLVPTGLACAIPNGYYGRIAPRSGLSVGGIDVHAGVIDSDYRGELKVLLSYQKPTGSDDHSFPVRKGDRIAQLIIEKIATPVPREVDDLDDTSRGAGGFGSTGVA